MSGTDGNWHPLRRWRVRNFKSVAGARVELSPLTVMVGANSSGKSSLLQSIVLVVQAMQGQASDEHLPLNGPYVELGEFDDVRHVGAAARDRVAVGGTFVLPAPERQIVPRRDRREDWTGGRSPVLEWDVELLNTARDDLPGRARLRGVWFSVGEHEESASSDVASSLEYRATVLSRRQLAPRAAVRRSHRRPIVRLEGRVTLVDAAGRARSVRTAGVCHRAGVPVAVFVEGDLHTALVTEWVDRVRQVLRDRRLSPRTEWNRIRDRRVGGATAASGKHD